MNKDLLEMWRESHRQWGEALQMKRTASAKALRQDSLAASGNIGKVSEA